MLSIRSVNPGVNKCIGVVDWVICSSLILISVSSWIYGVYWGGLGIFRVLRFLIFWFTLTAWEKSVIDGIFFGFIIFLAVRLFFIRSCFGSDFAALGSFLLLVKLISGLLLLLLVAFPLFLVNRALTIILSGLSTGDITGVFYAAVFIPWTAVGKL